MGMAASQARFLSLTARKSNVEYQGQQVNQERTALANESANLYTQLNSLEVPTPPIVEDFKKTEYSFTSSKVNGENKTYTLNEIVTRPDGQYVTLFSDKQYWTTGLADLGKGAKISRGAETLSNEQEAIYKDYMIGKDEGKDKYAGFTIQTVFSSTPLPVFHGKSDNHSSELVYIADPSEGGNRTFEELYLSDNDDGIAVEGEERKVKSGKDVYFYINNGKRYYLDPKDIESANANNSAETSTALYVVGETAKKQKEYKVVQSTTNDLGRLTSISIETDRKNGEDPIIETFELTVATVQDEEAYNQAMLDYEYQKSLYEKATSDINGKTAIIQSDDKTLELRLKQLDTEQSAIKTEMDAVQKVADDNVEATFKTFG